MRRHDGDVILSPSPFVILSEAKNLTPLRVNSVKSPAHSSERHLEILHSASLHSE